ncbi:MAG: hypothetical protein JNM84_18355 [Planctomycetes bacterium]|nr:hypothetical protein [Planctomycetota bacterium]
MNVKIFKSMAIAVFLATLASREASAQFGPDVYLTYPRAGVLELVRLPSDAPASLVASWVPAPGQLAGWNHLVFDPRTQAFWGILEGQGNGTPPQVKRLSFHGGTFSQSDFIDLPQWCSHNGAVAGAGIDEQGHLVALSGAGCYYRIDLEARVVVSVGSLCSCFASIKSFTPARAGRPALATAFSPTWETVVFSLDENFGVIEEFARIPPNLRSFLLPVVYGVTTTANGRSFVGAFGTDDPRNPMRGLYEIDFVNRRLIRRASELGNLRVSSPVVDDGRGVLHFNAGRDDQGLPPVNFRAVYDLHSDRVVGQYANPSTLASWFLGPPWFPRQQVLASPQHPSVGVAQSFSLPVGGGVGDAALLWCQRAEIGGVPMTGLDTLVAAGVVNGWGVLPVRIPYDPAVVPMQAGDAVWFQGFTWNGRELASTREVEIRWR